MAKAPVVEWPDEVMNVELEVSFSQKIPVSSSGSLYLFLRDSPNVIGITASRSLAVHSASSAEDIHEP